MLTRVMVERSLWLGHELWWHDMHGVWRLAIGMQYFVMRSMVSTLSIGARMETFDGCIS